MKPSRALLLVASSLVLLSLGGGCSSSDELTSSDLDTLCAAARAAESAPEAERPGVVIGQVLDSRPSVGLRTMLRTDMVREANKGQVIARWRARSELGDFRCAALEEVFPGATGAPP